MRIGTSLEHRKQFAVIYAVVGIPVVVACLWMAWYAHTHPEKQEAWECRPQPGYCDIDTDWRPAKRETNEN